ncbi:hypothetical protein JB92DRAFT_2834335 [Gautieria morchelliformis]|nr:hypothetical protein JB92DRAFT_2834335 [Gautieria morchelliformis]
MTTCNGAEGNLTNPPLKKHESSSKKSVLTHSTAPGVTPGVDVVRIEGEASLRPTIGNETLSPAVPTLTSEDTPLSSQLKGGFPREGQKPRLPSGHAQIGALVEGLADLATNQSDEPMAGPSNPEAN